MLWKTCDLIAPTSPRCGSTAKCKPTSFPFCRTGARKAEVAVWVLARHAIPAELLAALFVGRSTCVCARAVRAAPRAPQAVNHLFDGPSCYVFHRSFSILVLDDIAQGQRAEPPAVVPADRESLATSGRPESSNTKFKLGCDIGPTILSKRLHRKNIDAQSPDVLTSRDRGCLSFFLPRVRGRGGVLCPARPREAVRGKMPAGTVERGLPRAPRVV